MALGTEDVPLLASAPKSPSDVGTPIDVLEPEDVLGISHGTDILIVDDHPSNLAAYEAALEPLHRKLTLVKSGVEAIAALLEQDFALMLLDVSMAGMSGLETARMVRQRPRCMGMPIIFITGVAHSDELILEAYEVGAFDFVDQASQSQRLARKAAGVSAAPGTHADGPPSCQSDATNPNIGSPQTKRPSCVPSRAAASKLSIARDSSRSKRKLAEPRSR